MQSCPLLISVHPITDIPPLSVPSFLRIAHSPNYNSAHEAPASLQVPVKDHTRSGAAHASLCWVLPLRMEQGAGIAEGTRRARCAEAGLLGVMQRTHRVASRRR